MFSRNSWKDDLDLIDVMLGIWLVISPWLLGAMPRGSAFGTLVIMGLIVAAVALWALRRPMERVPEWIMLALGVMLFLSPWALGFHGETAATLNAWIVGAVLAVTGALAVIFKPTGTETQLHFHWGRWWPFGR